MAISKKSMVSNSTSKKPAKKVSQKVAQPVAATKLATARPAKSAGGGLGF